MPDGYYPLSLAAPLMPSEWRDLTNGKVRICCKDCGELYEADSLESGVAEHEHASARLEGADDV